MSADKTQLADNPLEELTRALQQCWRIAEPVYQGMQDDVSAVSTDYDFILKRAKDVNLVIVPDGEAMRQLIHAQHLKVVETFRVMAECD